MTYIMKNKNLRLAWFFSIGTIGGLVVLICLICEILEKPEGYKLVDLMVFIVATIFICGVAVHYWIKYKKLGDKNLDS